MGEECHGCHQWEEYHYLNHVPANGKLFFRLMVPQFSTSLKIPTKFMKHMAGEISGNIQLKDPSGILWHVKLVKNENGAFFQNGWKDFSVAHRLKENDLLLFKCIGNSCFQVNILEPSGCEKANSYCLKMKNLFEQEKGNSIELLSESEGTEGDEECDGLDQQEKVITKNVCLPRFSTFTTEEEMRVSQLVQLVHSDNPCFISVMSNTNINKCFMIIPKDFRIHLPSHSTRIILQVTGRRQTWNVGYHVRQECAGLYSCWQYFVRDNGLQIGDICLFELINKRRNNLKMCVKISRISTSYSLGSEGENRRVIVSTSDHISSSSNSTKEENSSGESTEINKEKSNDILANGKLSICMAKKTTLNLEEEKRASQLVRAFSTHNPYFLSVIRPHNSVSLCVPASFTKYLPSKSCRVTLQIQGTMKIWCATICKNEGTCRFIAGWPLFLRENKLSAGDLCLFELTNKRKDDPHFKVGISRAVKEEPL